MAVTNITAAVLQAFNTTLHTAFNKGLGAQNQDWMQIAKEIPSSAKSNTYAWLTQWPAFREWVGARLHKAINERAFSVTNRKFETTVDVPVDDFEDNNLGQWSGVTESYGEAIGDLKNDMVFGGVKSCLTAVCYDGQYFFDTDHPLYPNEDGTGTATTQSNFQTGAGELWVLLCTKRAPKPFYLQNRTGTPSLVAKTDLTSENVFEDDVFTWGAKWRGEFVPGFWQLAYGSKAALDATSFNAGYNSMMTIKGDGNRQLNIVPDTLVVGPANRVAAENLIMTKTLANGADNPLYNRVKLIVNPLMA
jgi:phage major head subunit gpT-like protein